MLHGAVAWLSQDPWPADSGHQRGAAQALVEYALIIALVVVVLVIIVMVIGNTTRNLFCNISGGFGG